MNAVTFIGTIDKLYVFFSSSSHRWETFKGLVTGKIAKRICETRWISRHDAVYGCMVTFGSNISGLEQLRDGNAESNDTTSDSQTLLNSIMVYNFTAYFFLEASTYKNQRHAKVPPNCWLKLDVCASKLGDQGAYRR